MISIGSPAGAELGVILVISTPELDELLFEDPLLELPLPLEDELLVLVVLFEDPVLVSVVVFVPPTDVPDVPVMSGALPFGLIESVVATTVA